MKTHIPTSLRKALLAALFATVSIASTTYAVEDVTNDSYGEAETWFLGNEYGSTGYQDLTFSGTKSVLGTVDHWCHDYNTIFFSADDCPGDNTEIVLSPDWSTGKFIAHSVTSSQGKDSHADLRLADLHHPDLHDHDSTDEYGFSTSWSNGNIYVNSEAVLEVTTNVSAHGTLSITDSSQVTVGNKVSAGEIRVTSGQLTAKDIVVAKHNLWDISAENPYDGEDSTGELLVSGSAANVTATGTVSATGGVNVSNKAHLNANTITSNVTGGGGYVRALPNQNLAITGVIASDGTQYIVDNGCTISLGAIGYYDEDAQVMHGNGNSFGYGEDSNNIKADSIYVNGDIISDYNKLGAVGNNEDATSCAIVVNGSITGNGNALQIRGQYPCGIEVTKDISGDNNLLLCSADGNVFIDGVLGRAKDEDNGAYGNMIAAGGAIQIGELSDNEKLTIESYNYGVIVNKASEATLLDSSIYASGDVVIAAGETGSTKELKLVNTDVTSGNGDITANQILVVDSGTISAVNGDVTAEGLDGTASSVYTQNLEAGFIRMDADGSAEVEVVVTGDMTSTEETILIKGYNGDQPRVTVDGNQTAQMTLEIIDSNVSVGGNQKSVEDGISVSKSTLVVGGDQETAKNINLASSTVDIAGDEKAGRRLEVHGTTLNVGGDQEAGTTLAIDTGSKVTVGHEDEETGEIVGGNQKAQGNITIEESEVTVLADQTSTGGSITIRDTNAEQNPTTVIVDGNQQANKNISVTGSTLHVGVLVEDEDTETYSIEGGKQIAGGDISIINSLVDVLDSMESTDGNIQIKDGTVTVGATDPSGVVVHAGDMTAKKDISMDHSMVNVLGGQKSSEGSISVTNGSVVNVDGDQTAGTTINVENSTLRVGVLVEDEDTETYSVEGGKQVAGGDISIINSLVDVLDSMESTDGNIQIKDGTVTVGATDPSGVVVQAGDMTAKKDISMDHSMVNVLGGQKSSEGSISVTKGSEVYVNEDQQAHGSISVNGSELYVGGSQVAETGGIQVSNGAYVAVLEDQQAAGDISIDGTSEVEVLGSQTSTNGAITMSNGSKVKVDGDQQASGTIKVDNADVYIGGTQKSDTGNIVIRDNAHESVFGDQTAEAGSIIVAKDSTLTVGAKDEDGNVISQGDQWAAKHIKIVAGSAVEVIGDQTARDEDIIVKGSTLTVGAIQENAPLVPGWPSTYELIGGNQTAGGNIVLVNDNKVDVLGDQDAGASIIVKKTTLTVGAKADEGKVVHAGDQTADGNIVIVKDSDVAILGNEMAGGDIVVKDSTLKVGELEHISIMPWPAFDWLHGGDQTANGNIFISNADVDVLRNQQAVTGAISIQKGSDVTIGSEDSAGHVLGGDQTAQTDINIANSTVHVLGDEEAVTGEIVIAKTDLEGADTIVNVDGDQTAQTNIIVRDADVTVLGDQTATEGYIDISSTSGTGITSTVNVGGDQEAGDYINVTNSQLTVGTVETITDETTGEQHVVLTGGNQTADTGDITISNSTVEVLGDQTATEGGIKIDKLSLVTIGTADENGDVLAGDQLAKLGIEVDSSNLMMLGDQTSQEGSISVQALEDYSFVIVGGSQSAKQNISILGSKEFETTTTVLVGEDQIAEEGNIAINDAQVAVNGKVVALGDGNDGTGIVAVAGSSYDVGVSLEAKELNIGTIDNPSTVTINVESLDTDGETPLPTVLDVDKLTLAANNTLNIGNVDMDAADVTIKGEVVAGVKDEDPEKAIAANWNTTGTHLVTGPQASMKVNGDVSMDSTGADQTLEISDGAAIRANGDITLAGSDPEMALVQEATLVAKDDLNLSNITLENNGENIRSKEGNIVLSDHEVISNTTLTIDEPTDPETTPGAIMVDKDAIVDLQEGTESVFNGALADGKNGTGVVNVNVEDLTLYKDASAFNGDINMNVGGVQTLYIANATGVGADATITLYDGADLETINTTGEEELPQLGNVVTTADGSEITLNQGVAGDTAKATSLSLTDGTTLNVEADQGETGFTTDSIIGVQEIDAQRARVAVHSTVDMETTPDGTRHTVVGLAKGGIIASEFNEDVLYDMNGTQRDLQTRNMHLEHNANGVDLVVSENYKGIDHNNANVNAVREIIMPLDAAADHRPGVLAQSTSNLDHILDALDYTRSGADAKAGLLSVSAAANLIVPNMMMDASRHHLSALRDHMNAPVCTKDTQSKGNVWAAYTGGHDFIGSDDNMGKYTHSYNGAIIGGDYAVNCNWAIGLSVGYQNSIARTDATRADADIISGDLYVVGRTGKFTHRFSMGLSAYNTDVKRGTRIAAKGHTYDELSTGDADGMSWNFGYQLSRSYAINEVSAITPYLAVDVALQRIDTMTEKGQGDASVVTDYEDFVQTDAALGVSYSHTFASFNQQRGMFAFDLAVHGEFSEHRATAQNHFVDSPQDTWKTRSAKRAPLYGELGGHVQVPFTEHFSGTAGVNFEFSDDRTYIGGHAGVNYRF